MKRSLCLILGLLLVSVFANAANLDVNCALPGKAGSIMDTLRQLDPAGPNVVTLHGTCHENLVIHNFDRLTLRGAPGAEISDASGGTEWAVVLISDSRRIRVRGLKITGGMVGIECTDGSRCEFGMNTLEGQSQRGFSIDQSEATFNGDVVTGSADTGLYISVSKAQMTGVTAEQNKTGMNIGTSSVVADNMTINNNTETGIFVSTNSHLQLIDSNVSFNGMNGIQATAVTSLSLVNNTVTGNFMSGVWASDIVTMYFVGGNYSGNDIPGINFNIGCYGKYALVSNLSSAVYGTTNCTQ